MKRRTESLAEQCEPWLNSPEWIDPIARAVDEADDFADVPSEARALIRHSAIMARAAKDARLKKRTLTSLYNERPTWLRLLQEQLDRAVLAAYAADSKVPPPIKRPSDKALVAWRLRDLQGIRTQPAIAAAMSRQLGRTIGQGQVSRWLGQVEAYLKAGNVLPDLSKLSAEPQSVDPKVLEMGKRVDRRTRRQRTRRDSDSD